MTAAVNEREAGELRSCEQFGCDGQDEHCRYQVPAEPEDEPVQAGWCTQPGQEDVLREEPGECNRKQDGSDVEAERPHGLVHHVQQRDTTQREVQGTVAECRQEGCRKEKCREDDRGLLPGPSRCLVNCRHADFQHGDGGGNGGKEEDGKEGHRKEPSRRDDGECDRERGERELGPGRRGEAV